MSLPFGYSWGLVAALGAAASYALLAFATSLLNQKALYAALVAAWLMHAWALADGLLGEPMRFGFAPALSMTVWLVLSVYAVEARLLPQLRAHWALAGLGAAAVVVALFFPGSAYTSPASSWLALHWALGLASYGLFASAAIHGWLMNRAEASIRGSARNDTGVPLMQLERLTFRFVQAGFALLSATLLVGWLFAEDLYGPGRVWQWNHKTIFSVLSWAVFAGLLLGRTRLGWRGRKATSFLYVGAALLLLAYVGSRFVIEVILGRA